MISGTIKTEAAGLVEWRAVEIRIEVRRAADSGFFHLGTLRAERDGWRGTLSRFLGLPRGDLRGLTTHVAGISRMIEVLDARRWGDE